MTLDVSDDGVGFQPNLEFPSSSTLGLSLVLILTEQIRGTIQLDRRRGTRFADRDAV